jgi:hypothetical protein
MHRLQMFALMPDGTRLATDEVQASLRCPTPVDYWGGRPPGSPIDHWAPDPSGLGATEARMSPSTGQTSGRAPDTAPDAASAMVLDGGTIDVSPADPSSQRSAQCSPLIGTRTGRPLLWLLFPLLIAIVAGRTERQPRAFSSTRQSGFDAGARLPPRV